MRSWRASLPARRLARRYVSLFRRDLAAGHARDLRKWMLAAAALGLASGLLITLIIEVVLVWIWPPLLRLDLRHEVAIVPVLALGFLVAGLIMQHLTPDPDLHSTEEIIHAFHERQGRIDMRAFVPKLVAAVATVGSGGSAALEGPSVYGGGALGSWLWARFARAGLAPRDRRILLISGAAAGMAAVFRAPLTGVVFALEMPYTDDLAREALLPSLIASVVSYATMAAFLGSRPIFDFPAAGGYTGRDLWWAALLGLGGGLLVAAYSAAYRRFRGMCRRSPLPHWVKMTAGGALTGLCGLLFVTACPGALIPIGPNYEAVAIVLRAAYPAGALALFGALKLAATLFSLGVGGVSAMFVPLFLSGGSFGTAFGRALAHSPSPGLFAAVGMAAFLAAGYKTPLTAVVFVAEATGGHAFIVPSLIGAAVAYGVSGESSVSQDQRPHERARVAELLGLTAADAVRRDVASVEAGATLLDFARTIGSGAPVAAYPVRHDGRVVGLIPPTALGRVPPREWERRLVGELADRGAPRVDAGCDLREALRTLLAARGQAALVVTAEEEDGAGAVVGVLAAADVLAALGVAGAAAPGS